MVFSDNEKTRIYERLNNAENALQAFTGISRGSFSYDSNGDKAYLEALNKSRMNLVEIKHFEAVTDVLGETIEGVGRRVDLAREYTDDEIYELRKEILDPTARPPQTATGVAPNASRWNIRNIFKKKK